jgi:hypothetical protein
MIPECAVHAAIYKTLAVRYKTLYGVQGQADMNFKRRNLREEGFREGWAVCSVPEVHGTNESG